MSSLTSPQAHSQKTEPTPPKKQGSSASPTPGMSPPTKPPASGSKPPAYRANLFLPLHHAFQRSSQAYEPRKADLTPSERCEELVELECYPWIVSDHHEDADWGHWHTYTAREKEEFRGRFERWAETEEQHAARRAQRERAAYRSYESRHPGRKAGPWRMYELRNREEDLIPEEEERKNNLEAPDQGRDSHTDQAEGGSSSQTSSGQIVLQVGERRFITTKETLTDESEFFTCLLSGRWSSNAQTDGSWFIDADPGLFEHILRYLRRGVLPIFHDSTKGHDHALYRALSVEADFFQIPRLRDWLKQKQYLRAVTTKIYPTVVEGIVRIPGTLAADEQVEYYPVWQMKKIYLCPRGIPVHRGSPELCGRACSNARGSETQYDEEQVLKTLIVSNDGIAKLEL
ncbi:BTB POZ domain-containing KCTD4 [Hyphodiscus hymeniophilus]|uniref:BTB POZ domain-containing KCTD4 n=1 Tax=Hyphodiscus hymeniophilus TaxID=353542 RepID=A0A9P6VQF2_9HELO|nr:BTB POZ domain-containing KCTD4 [Hyphodiscus hymeniophilus]